MILVTGALFVVTASFTDGIGYTVAFRTISGVVLFGTVFLFGRYRLGALPAGGVPGRTPD